MSDSFSLLNEFVLQNNAMEATVIANGNFIYPFSVTDGYGPEKIGRSHIVCFNLQDSSQLQESLDFPKLIRAVSGKVGIYYEGKPGVIKVLDSSSIDPANKQFFIPPNQLHYIANLNDVENPYAERERYNIDYTNTQHVRFYCIYKGHVEKYKRRIEGQPEKVSRERDIRLLKAISKPQLSIRKVANVHSSNLKKQVNPVSIMDAEEEKEYGEAILYNYIKDGIYEGKKYTYTGTFYGPFYPVGWRASRKEGEEAMLVGFDFLYYNISALETVYVCNMFTVDENNQKQNFAGQCTISTEEDVMEVDTVYLMKKMRGKGMGLCKTLLYYAMQFAIKDAHSDSIQDSGTKRRRRSIARKEEIVSKKVVKLVNENEMRDFIEQQKMNLLKIKEARIGIVSLSPVSAYICYKKAMELNGFYLIEKGAKPSENDTERGYKSADGSFVIGDNGMEEGRMVLPSGNIITMQEYNINGYDRQKEDKYGDFGGMYSEIMIFERNKMIIDSRKRLIPDNGIVKSERIRQLKIQRRNHDFKIQQWLLNVNYKYTKDKRGSEGNRENNSNISTTTTTTTNATTSSSTTTINDNEFGGGIATELSRAFSSCLITDNEWE